MQTALKFSPLSERAGRVRPGRKLMCSREIGWKSILLQTFEQPSSVEAFVTSASPDLLLVLVVRGEYEIESCSSGSWKGAAYRPGVGGLTAAWTTNRLRWHSTGTGSSELIRIYIPNAYFLEAGEEYRRAGLRSARIVPDTLSFSDPVVFSVATSLANAARRGAPDLYADSGARFLATHLLSQANCWSEDVLNRNTHRKVPDRRFARMLEYLHHHFLSEVTVEDLAHQAGISRFHFSRLFRAKLGLTPHRLIVQLRMNHASTLLTETDRSISEVSMACGYTHDGHFAAAFRQQFGMSPSSFRKRIRS